MICRPQDEAIQAAWASEPELADAISIDVEPVDGLDLKIVSKPFRLDRETNLFWTEMLPREFGINTELPALSGTKIKVLIS